MNEPTSHSLNEHPVSSVDREDDAVIVRLVGELDLYNAPALRTSLLELMADQPRRLVLDLTEVDFVDSTALGVLVEARSKLADRQAFLLAAPGADTHRALKVSGLDRHLSVHPSVEAALAAPLVQP
jgi:anti-sigma B factor antagonist